MDKITRAAIENMRKRMAGNEAAPQPIWWHMNGEWVKATDEPQTEAR